jgi:hypothetical protein
MVLNAIYEVSQSISQSTETFLDEVFVFRQFANIFSLQAFIRADNFQTENHHRLDGGRLTEF